MSPRPRKVTDDELFAATYAAMTKLGPGELTLAAIAKEAGVTAAVLVQRFGSKRDLLLTLAERFSGGAGEMMTALRASGIDRRWRRCATTRNAWPAWRRRRPRSRATSRICRST